MHVWIYTTAPNHKSAEKISSYLLKKKLVACVNMFPVKSQYWWKKKILKNSEVALIIKTSSKKKNKALSEIKKIHPYKLPDIVSFDVDSSKEVIKWIEDSLE